MKPVALVTGGSRGIGFGIASCLANAGYDLVIFGTRPQEAVHAALTPLRALGAELLYCACDVSDAAARQTAIAAIRARFDRLDVLVNNAGIAPTVRADILEASEASYDQVLNVNLKGPYFLTQTVANWMISQRGCHSDYRPCIINISSISATVASPNRGEYCLSKAGISMATQLWATRLGEYEIPVYEVRPGVIQTDMTSVVTAKYDKLIADGLCVQKRWGQPDDVGKAVAMLARGDLPYSTGQVLMIDGGLTLARL